MTVLTEPFKAALDEFEFGTFDGRESAGFDGEGTCTGGAYSEAPLTAEPFLAEDAPLTSEPPLAVDPPLTSEPPLGGCQDPMEI